MPQLVFYGAVGEIGGNKVLLKDKDTNLFLDFGAGFSEGKSFYSDEILPRRVNGLGDYFEFDLMPKINGLYSSGSLVNTDLKYQRPEFDAIVLSHYHYDHMGRIGFVDPEIPVYCGETTKLFHEAYSEAGGSPLDGHEIFTFRTGEKKKIGGIELIPIHVDHSIPGAYGFIIHYSEGAIVYTGDFRFHGPKGSMTEDFALEAQKANPDFLITEGTRVVEKEKREGLSEPEVLQKTGELLKNNKKLAFSTFRGNDIDRINSFAEACKMSGRNLVVSMKTAILLKTLESDKNLKVPRVGKDVSVFVRRKASGKYDDKDYYKWERSFLDKGMTCSDIKKKQEGTFLHLDVWNLPEIIDIKPNPGGVYIHSSSEAFNEEGEQEEQLVRNWIDHFGFSYNQVHASGHAPMTGVKHLVEKVNAKISIPIHTEHPEIFTKTIRREGILMPERGIEIDLN